MSPQEVKASWSEARDIASAKAQQRSRHTASIISADRSHSDAHTLTPDLQAALSAALKPHDASPTSNNGAADQAGGNSLKPQPSVAISQTSVEAEQLHQESGLRDLLGSWHVQRARNHAALLQLARQVDLRRAELSASTGAQSHAAALAGLDTMIRSLRESLEVRGVCLPEEPRPPPLRTIGRAMACAADWLVAYRAAVDAPVRTRSAPAYTPPPYGLLTALP